MRSILATSLGATLLAAGAIAPAVAATPASLPRVVNVIPYATPKGQQQLTIIGKNFGPAPGDAPCANCTVAELSIYNGGTPYSVPLWSDKRVVVTRASQPAGTQNLLFVENNLGQIAPGAYSIPGGTAHPAVTSVTFGGTGVNRTITVNGTGFGVAPSGIPGNTNIGNFTFVLVNSDFNNCCLITPGGDGGPHGSSWGGWNAGYWGDGVTLKYMSWTDTQIVIQGFGTEYGQNGYVVNYGDRYYIMVTSTNYTGNNTTWFSGIVE